MEIKRNLHRIKQLFRDKKRDIKLQFLARVTRFPKADFNDSISHIAAFQLMNAGDRLLPITLKDLFHLSLGEIRWKNFHVHRIVTPAVIQKINRSRGLIIGGGGLFLRDTNENDLSGWQWSCSLEMLRRIKVPIFIFAVGYNRFRNQPNFEPIFKDHLNLLAEKTVYLGIRNSGSIRSLKKYLYEEHHHKLRFQPCMTTVISKIYSNLIQYDQKENFIALNCAFDRTELRFSDKKEESLTRLAAGIKKISHEIPLKYYSHMKRDEEMLHYFDKADIPYELLRLNILSPAEIIKAYARPKLVIGMRGHSQMIPFGTLTPIISLITHEKMQYFFDDIGQKSRGLEMSGNDYENLISLDEGMITNNKQYINIIKNIQNKFYQISNQNVVMALEAMHLPYPLRY